MADQNPSRRDFAKKTVMAAVGAGLLNSASRSRFHTVSSQSALVYVGTYTSGDSQGIYILSLDYASGELRSVETINGVTNPSYLALNHHRNYLYAVNEETEFQGKKSGAVSAFAIDKNTGSLKFLNKQATLGGAPCYVSVSINDKYILVANYVGGNVSVFPVMSDGSLGASIDVEQHTGKSVNPDRQEGPHAHCIVLDPSGRFAYSCDLGTDKIMIYRFDSASGNLTHANQPFVASKPGSGPRHLTLHTNGLYAYVINELDCTVSVLAVDKSTGALKEIQNLPTLPSDFKSQNTSADIHVSPNGKFLYCSNRGFDGITAFKIDEKSGKLEFLSRQSTMGKTPRNFVIDPTGKFLLVANQTSNSIVTFRIDPATGTLTPTGHSATIPTPVCLKF